MTHGCQAVPYQGTMPYICLYFTQADCAAGYTLAELLAREGYRVWYDRGEGGAQEVGAALGGCRVLAALYSDAAQQEHDFRKVISAAKFGGKPILGVMPEGLELSFGMNLQLEGAQKLVWQGADSDLSSLAGHADIAACRGEPCPQIQVIRREEEKKQDGKPRILLSGFVTKEQSSEAQRLLESLEAQKKSFEARQPEAPAPQKTEEETKPEGAVPVKPALPTDLSGEETPVDALSEWPGANARLDDMMEGLQPGRREEKADERPTLTAQADGGKIRRRRRVGAVTVMAQTDGQEGEKAAKAPQQRPAHGRTQIVSLPPQEQGTRGRTQIVTQSPPVLVSLKDGKVYRGALGTTMVSREGPADMVIPAGSISVDHLQILSVSGGGRTEYNEIQDNCSSNGTWIDGKRIAPLTPVSVGEYAEVRLSWVEPFLFMSGSFAQKTLPLGCAASLLATRTQERKFLFEDSMELGRYCAWSGGLLDSEFISSSHARIVRQGDAYELVDLDSVNGTWLDGRRLAPGERAVLCGGEEIRIGYAVFVFEMTRFRE